MRHLLFGESETYPTALLIKPTGFTRYELEQAYVAPLETLGLAREHVIAMTLEVNTTGKAPAGLCKQYLAQLLPALTSVGVKTLYVTDGDYFKVLTGARKSEPHYGYALPCKVVGFERLTVVLGVNHKALLFNPNLSARLTQSLETLAAVHLGTYTEPGQGIIRHAEYPRTLSQVEAALEKLHQYPLLSADIETFGLDFSKAGIATIGFAWNRHEGLAFPVDYKEVPDPRGYYQDVDCATHYGVQHPKPQYRALLKQFLETYRGTLIWHGSSFDLRVLIYTLWMQHALDQAGLLKGLDVMTRVVHDTKLIAYLATNSTAGNKLGLKYLAQSFAGNYAQDEIKDVRRIPLKELLQYNLVDCLSTWYVFDTYYPKLVTDNQQEIYEQLFLPSQKTLIQTELTGMPLDAAQVQLVKQVLEGIRDQYLATLTDDPHGIIRTLNLLLQDNEWQKDFEARQSKAKHPHKIQPKDKAAFTNVAFNPNSPPQIQKLVYETMGLPVIDLTDTKQPATGAETLEKLLNHTQAGPYKAILEALIGYAKVDKILGTFIKRFEEALVKGDGWSYLHGNFNLGGTVSGRLSSNDPNLQNLPANVTMVLSQALLDRFGAVLAPFLKGNKLGLGKLVKSCFKAPKGWILVGADFASLEDRINALLTKDPAKLRVYTDGFDGHCLRAYAYFGDQMPDIDPDSVESINSIEAKYPHLRQESKSPTFALTYQGTWMTMVKNLGWGADKAKQVEARYHALYAVSTEWVKDKIAEATQCGYALGAFGLRIRTPLLHSAILGHRTTPREAEAEARTLGNAISGQSYGLLNSRAANAFMEKVWESPYRLEILPVGQIHDASYYLIRDRLEVVQFVNRHLIEAMRWQELPEIQHDQVKLGAELDLYHPSWATPITLPNGASDEEILALCRKTTQPKEVA